MRPVIRLLKKRGRGGFTLVEMIVSVALLAILLGGMMIFISPIIRSFNDTTTNLTAENTATCIEEYITKSIRNASQIGIFANTSSTSVYKTYQTQIGKMNSFCNSVNGTSTNKTYELRCISLKYDDTDKKYYLYNEAVNMAANGQLSGTSTLAFSKSLYTDLYLTISFELPANADYGSVDSASPSRNDALQTTVKAYTDENCTSLAFQGDGITELRQIKVMLANGGTAEQYYITIPSAVTDFSASVAGSRDIFIYYVVRRITTETSSTPIEIPSGGDSTGGDSGSESTEEETPNQSSEESEEGSSIEPTKEEEKPAETSSSSSSSSSTEPTESEPTESTPTTQAGTLAPSLQSESTSWDNSEYYKSYNFTLTPNVTLTSNTVNMDYTIVLTFDTEVTYNGTTGKTITITGNGTYNQWNTGTTLYYLSFSSTTNFNLVSSTVTFTEK